MDKKSEFRYLFIFFSKNTKDKYSEMISEHVHAVKSKFYIMEIDNLTFISFFSTSKISSIKDTLGKHTLKPLFIGFDISDQYKGEVFEMFLNKLEPKVLLTDLNVDTGTDVDPIKKMNDDILDLNGILELLNKNGYSSLSDRQKKWLDDYANE